MFRAACVLSALCCDTVLPTRPLDAARGLNELVRVRRVDGCMSSLPPPKKRRSLWGNAPSSDEVEAEWQREAAEKQREAAQKLREAEAAADAAADAAAAAAQRQREIDVRLCLCVYTSAGFAPRLNSCCLVASCPARRRSLSWKRR